MSFTLRLFPLVGAALLCSALPSSAIEGPIEEGKLPITNEFVPPPPRVVEPAPEADLDALASALFSGLPLSALQAQFLASLTETVLQDVNARLFRLRAGAGQPPAGAAGPSGKESKTVIEEAFHHWELFAAGNYGRFELEDRGRRDVGFESDTWVGTLGAEYRVNRHLAFGLAASYVESHADLTRQIGGAEIEGLALSAYASAIWDRFYFDLLYSYGAYDESTRRNTFTGPTAHGDTAARTHAIQFNTGYVLQIGALRTGPIAALNWVHGEIDAYNETGGGAAALENPGQDFDSLVSQLGWQLSYVAPTPCGTFTPQLRASWDHEYLNSSEEISATLQQSPFANGGRSTATGRTTQAGRDFLNLGAGVSAQFGDRVTVTVDYQTHLFQERATAHIGSLKVGISF